MKIIRTGLILALIAALCACSQDDAASGQSKLIGSYRLVVAKGQPTARKDFAGSMLRLSSDGMFAQQCRYRNGKTDSVVGTWSYSDQRAHFSAFKDCAGVLPGRGKRNASATFAVDFGSPTAIVVSSGTKARYERAP